MPNLHHETNVVTTGNIRERHRVPVTRQSQSKVASIRVTTGRWERGRAEVRMCARLSPAAMPVPEMRVATASVDVESAIKRQLSGGGGRGSRQQRAPHVAGVQSKPHKG
jgi:hypothetical protein